MIETGDIVRVDLNPTIGHEKKKERFCLVVEKGSSYFRTVSIERLIKDKSGSFTSGKVREDVMFEVRNNHPLNVKNFQPCCKYH